VSTPEPAATQPSSDRKDLVRVEELKVYFPVRDGVVINRKVGDIKAVDGVSFEIRRGETLGLVGESGCGKTTVGRAILRLYKPTEGHIYFEDVDVATISDKEMRKLRRRMQMVFQDPYSSLNPRQNVENIVTEPMLVHGTADRKEASVKARELLEIVGLPKDSTSRYPHEFSGGQRQRIGLARALSLNPDLIVADEPVSALDVSIQAQALNLLQDLQGQFDLTYLFIAHDLAVVRHLSHRIAVMYLGKIMEVAPADDLYAAPLHPYTIALLSAVPIPDPAVESRRQRVLLPGDLPSPRNPPSGCRFHTRCPFAQTERCPDEVPALRLLQPDHLVACHYAEEIRDGKIEARPPEEAGVEVPGDPQLV